MARQPKTPVALPEDRLNELLGTLSGRLEAEDSAKGLFEELVADLRREILDPATARRLEAEYAIVRHVGKSPRRFFPVDKTVKRRLGTVKRRKTPPAVVLPQPDEVMLQFLLDRELYQFVAWEPAKPRINREYMHDHPEEARQALDARFVSREELRVQPSGKRASYVLSGRRLLEQLRLVRSTPSA
jgi:hypothetical protein